MNEYLSRATPDCVDLSLGAPSEAGLAPNPVVSVYSSAISGYPPCTGLPELRQAVAQKLATENAITLDGLDEVAITNGVSQAIHIVFDTFVNAGDKVVLIDPTFLVYPLAAQYHRARVAWVPSYLDNGRTVPDPRALERSMRGAKLIVVNSPSNPTGGILDHETLERILYLARRHDLLIFSDEVYERFRYGSQPASIGSLPGARERTITANSFSKSYGMAGCRIGYLAAIRYLMRPMAVHQFIATPFVSCDSQKLAMRALASGPEAFRSILGAYRARRDWLYRELCAMGLPSELPAGAFYFWLPVGRFGMTSLQFAHALFDSERVLLMPGENFGPTGAGHVRLSYAADRDKVEEGAARLRRFIESLSNGATNGADRHELGRIVRLDSAHGSGSPHRTYQPTPAAEYSRQ
jgi:aminotransferase